MVGALRNAIYTAAAAQRPVSSQAPFHVPCGVISIAQLLPEHNRNHRSNREMHRAAGKPCGPLPCRRRRCHCLSLPPCCSSRHVRPNIALKCPFPLKYCRRRGAALPVCSPQPTAAARLPLLAAASSPAFREQLGDRKPSLGPSAEADTANGLGSRGSGGSIGPARGSQQQRCQAASGGCRRGPAGREQSSAAGAAATWEEAGRAVGVPRWVLAALHHRLHHLLLCFLTPLLKLPLSTHH